MNEKGESVSADDVSITSLGMKSVIKTKSFTGAASEGSRARVEPSINVTRCSCLADVYRETKK